MDRDNVNAADGSSNGKGKEKETTLASQPRPNSDSDSKGQSSESDSVISRLTSSTTQLAKDLITSHATAIDMAQIQPSNKAGPATPTLSKEYSATADASIRPLTPVAAVLGRNFRSQGPEGSTSNESGFSAFLDDSNRLESTEGSYFDASQRPGSTKLQLQPLGQINVPAAEPVEDGSEVVKFLDSRYDEVMSRDPEVPLSAEEQTALRRALFQDDGQWKRKPVREYQEDILNFFPDFISGATGKSADLSNHLGVSNPENSKMVWVSHWQDVLSNYNDEVWGDLGSLVEEAREELLVLSSSPQQTPISGSGALRRLQQILAHVRRF